MPELIYLASPYSHKDPVVKELRFRSAARIGAKMMAAGKYIFSPISHTHPIALAGKLPGEWQFWEGYDRVMIKCCQRLTVAKIDGWETSTGVQAEIKIANELGIPVDYVESDGVWGVWCPHGELVPTDNGHTFEPCGTGGDWIKTDAGHHFKTDRLNIAIAIKEERLDASAGRPLEIAEYPM
jgi:hypothetical protein